MPPSALPAPVDLTTLDEAQRLQGSPLRRAGRPAAQSHRHRTARGQGRLHPDRSARPVDPGPTEDRSLRPAAPTWSACARTTCATPPSRSGSPPAPRPSRYRCGRVTGRSPPCSTATATCSPAARTPSWTRSTLRRRCYLADVPANHARNPRDGTAPTESGNEAENDETPAVAGVSPLFRWWA